MNIIKIGLVLGNGRRGEGGRNYFRNHTTLHFFFFFKILFNPRWIGSITPKALTKYSTFLKKFYNWIVRPMISYAAKWMKYNWNSCSLLVWQPYLRNGKFWSTDYGAASISFERNECRHNLPRKRIVSGKIKEPHSNPIINYFRRQSNFAFYFPSESWH